jgi:BirA family transcriptional regulator, biotin operon repressor / biotin---[acetyl-CoA-carboxylase] ligase
MFKIYHFNKLNSTNDKAKNFKENAVIIADEQTKGKGRFKRIWNSGKSGIYLSIVLPEKDVSYLTFIAAISAQKAIKDTYSLKTMIKWPNDLLYKKNKLCGILTEIKDKKAIVGIGINTNNKVPLELKNKATSLSKILNQDINNKKIINKLLNYFEKYLKLLKSRKYSKIISDWKKLSFLGEKVKIKTLNKTIEGVAYDIDNECFLIVKTNKLSNSKNFKGLEKPKIFQKGKKIRIIEGDIFIQ